MKTLTVITTTYNRAYCLEQLYQSLISQQNNDFIWLVIDDGSTDNTKELIDKWQHEGLVEIEYYYKQNGGMHTARNLAYEKVYTELNTIIDSDDWMAPDAVDNIITFWNKNKDEKHAGMITLNRNPDGEVVGSDMPDNVTSCSYIDFWKKYNMKGDKKLVYRSELTKQYPYPEFENEKFFPASLKFYLIDKDYDIFLCNFTTCIVDYNDDSMTRDKYAQYKSCPLGFMYYRREMLKFNTGFKTKVKNMLHYIMEYSIAKTPIDKEMLSSPLFYFCFIPGKMFYYYITRTKRKY